MAQHPALLTTELTLTPPQRGMAEWQIAGAQGPVGHVRPATDQPGHARLHGLAFDIAMGRLDDGHATLWRPMRLTLEGPNLFHAWTVPRRGLLARALGQNTPLYLLHDHAPPLRMMRRGGLNRQIALLAGDDLLALADHPRSRAPCRIRHAPTLPPAIQAALCHAVTRP